jgi:hypothetical protein
VQDNTYVSPNSGFQIQVPTLLKPGAKIQDATRPGQLLVSFSDDLCRLFIAIESQSESDNQSLDAWVDATVMPELMQKQVAELERKTVQTRYGTAVFLRYRQPAASPCATMTISEGKQVVTRPDAEVGMYNLHVSGYYYRFMYVIDNTPALDMWGGRRPLDQLLEQFVAGFEILRAR